ncbi:hypothetical protein B0T10DRAFT_587692 [Thelonectria olida]|uniref:Uncharacterized protein n=1 Tax=Thelonectria olida TaxID=1576542 RepID=A0A9P8WBB0_9HYPO|nr:hypothetical protein B0T10DRAFT_587692 [Thelonectria olida]
MASPSLNRLAQNGNRSFYGLLSWLWVQGQKLYGLSQKPSRSAIMRYESSTRNWRALVTEERRVNGSIRNARSYPKISETRSRERTNHGLSDKATNQGFGNTLVIAGHSAQKIEGEGRLQQLSDAEVPKNPTEVQTIDDSPSHEADLVVVDLFRTKAPGFSTMQTDSQFYELGLESHGNKQCLPKKSDCHLGKMVLAIEKMESYYQKGY